MTLTQIRYFIKVAEYNNFTAAANNLFVSQQVISKQIENLEKEIGVKLFKRTTRHVVLTESGKIMYNVWKEMITRTDDAIENARKIENLNCGKIRLGVTEIASIVDHTANCVIEFQGKNVDFELETEITYFKRLQDMLNKGEVDLIISISSELEKLSQEFEITVLNELKLGIFISKKHQFADRENLTVKELQHETFFTFSDNYSNDAQEKIINHCKMEGFTPKELKNYNSIGSMEMALYNGRGVTICFDLFFRNRNNLLKMYPITYLDESANVYIVAAYRKKDKQRLDGILDYIKNGNIQPINVGNGLHIV